MSDEQTQDPMLQSAEAMYEADARVLAAAIHTTLIYISEYPGELAERLRGHLDELLARQLEMVGGPADEPVAPEPEQPAFKPLSSKKGKADA